MIFISCLGCSYCSHFEVADRLPTRRIKGETRWGYPIFVHIVNTVLQDGGIWRSILSESTADFCLADHQAHSWLTIPLCIAKLFHSDMRRLQTASVILSSPDTSLNKRDYGHRSTTLVQYIDLQCRIKVIGQAYPQKPNIKLMSLQDWWTNIHNSIRILIE